MKSNIRNIYSDPAVYDAAHWWKTNDIEFVCDLISKYGDPVLELGAGTGRLAKPIMEKGLSYHGLDTSVEYVAWAKNKLKAFANLGTIDIGDMRNIKLDQTFQTCFIGFNSIFHLMTNDDIESCFNSVYDHLADGGHFFFDMFLPDPSFLHRENIQHHVLDFDHPEGGKCTIKETNDYDEVTQVNAITWYFYRENRAEPDMYNFDMHMIYPDTIFRLLSETGFTIKHVWGDYDKSAMDEDGRLQFYVCQKL